MKKILTDIVWDIFIEETMSEQKAKEYVERLEELTEDFCYITYASMLEELNRENIGLDIPFEGVNPLYNKKKIKKKYDGGAKKYRGYN